MIPRSVIDAGSNSNFLFVDQVHAAYKPTSDGTNNGIKVQANGGATLRVEAGPDDTSIAAQTASSVTTVHVQDTSSHSGYSRMGSGVGNLVIRTNDVIASDYYHNDGDGTFVHVLNLGSGIYLTVDTGDGTYDEIALGDGGSIDFNLFSSDFSQFGFPT
jgi:hypothetical protein